MVQNLVFLSYVVVQAFVAAWQAACNSVGHVKLAIPEGTYLVGPIKFTGPCRNVSSMTVQVKVSFNRKRVSLAAQRNLFFFILFVYFRF